MTDFLTTGQAAKAMGVSKDTIRRWIDNGYLIASRMPGDGPVHYRIHVTHARQFAKQNAIPFILNDDTLATRRSNSGRRSRAASASK